MAEAGEADARPYVLAEPEVDLPQRDEPDSPDEHEDEPGMSPSRSLPFTTASEVSFRSSSSEISFRSSVDDLELEDDDMMYRLMQSEYEEIPSFRWIASPLRWWKTKRSRRKTHPSRRSNASTASSRVEKPVLEADARVESNEETRDGLAHIDGHAAYTIEELLRSSAVLLGKGTCGTMYGATLEDGNQVAVKRLGINASGITREVFEAEVSVLGRVRHPNLLALRAYYFSKDEKLLLFDYMPIGSLSSVLHDSSRDTPLDWPTRMDIVIGIARGLLHLHIQENMFHGNLTSKNVLLDDHTNAKISDYGIPSIRAAATYPDRTAVTLRYRAPELHNFMCADSKTDVFSLGMIMIEIITGKSPVEVMDGQDLPQWVSSAIEEGRTHEVFDAGLLKNAAGEEVELFNTLYLALSCVDPLSRGRPDVMQVLQQLEEIKQEIAALRGAAIAEQADDQPSNDGSYIEISLASSPRITEERMAPLSEIARLGASPTSNALANEENRPDIAENITSSAPLSPASSAETMPTPTSPSKDGVEEPSALTSQGDLEESEDAPTQAPKEEIVQDPSLIMDELQVLPELGDAESTASVPSDHPQVNKCATLSTFYMDEAGQALQTPTVATDHKIEEKVSSEEIDTDTSSGGVLVSPLSSINWEEVTFEARLDVPTTPPLITSDPDLVYQRFFKTLYDLAHHSPPLPYTVLEVQLNRMVMGLQSLGYPLDTWLGAATLVLVTAEKREYIERHVGDYKAQVEAQLVEFASVVAPVKEEVSRTLSDITTLEQEQEELDERLAKLKEQVAITVARRNEVAGSLAIARDQLAVAGVVVESASANMNRLNRQHSAIPELKSALLHELPSLDEVFHSSFREIMTRNF